MQIHIFIEIKPKQKFPSLAKYYKEYYTLIISYNLWYVFSASLRTSLNFL